MVVDETALRAAFGDFIQTPTGDSESEELCRLLVDHTRAVLDAEAAALALLEDDGLQVVASHGVAAGLQATPGPRAAALKAGELAASTDLAVESRWPGFCRAAADRGLQAVASVPLVHDEDPLGVLEVYWREPHELTATEAEAGRLLADMGAGALATRLALAAARQRADQLQHALNSRITVEQAKGLLAERHRIAPEIAYEAIRHHARAHNQTVHAVAGAVLAGELAVV